MIKAEQNLITRAEAKEIIVQPRHLRIGVEGPMGSGKTTLMEKLQELWPEAKFIDEVFMENPYLAKYYDNPGLYAFHSQIRQLGTKVNLLQGVGTDKPSVFVTLKNDKSYAETLLSKDDLGTYLLLYRIFIDQKVIPQPDVLLKLVIADKSLESRVNNRGRDIEKNVDPNFLTKLNQIMTKNSEESGIPIIPIDSEHQDFRNPERMAEIVEGIEYKIDQLFKDKFKDPSSGLLLPSFIKEKGGWA